MIRAVFFDFGGVIARLDREEMARLEAKYGLPSGALWDSLYGIPEWQALRVGRGSEEEWLEAVGRRLDELAGRPIPGIREDWAQVWRGLDEEILRLMRALRGRYRVGLISNATLRLDEELREHHRIDHLFDIIVNSARVGVAKPDVRIYRLAAERLGVEPPACVHIDDLVPNVQGARQAGFHALHYTGDYPSLERDLRALGVEW